MFVSSFKKGQWYGFFLMTQKFEVKNLEYIIINGNLT